jgi:hypothetical protein
LTPSLISNNNNDNNNDDDDKFDRRSSLFEYQQVIFNFLLGFGLNFDGKYLLGLLWM